MLRPDKIIVRESEEYPQRCNFLNDVPSALYMRGDLSALTVRPLIAIVGKRNCTDYGAKSAQELASFLSANGFNIVSGLARGIDTQAHKGALAAGGQTIAVLYDIERIKPASNVKLATEIVEKNGLLIAEQPPGSLYAPHLLIRRNRIIAALSFALFLIETDGKGGSMHTLRYARECGLPVFCIHPDELGKYSKPAYASGIANIVKEPGTWVYRTTEKDQLLDQLSQFGTKT